MCGGEGMRHYCNAKFVVQSETFLIKWAVCVVREKAAIQKCSLTQDCYSFNSCCNKCEHFEGGLFVQPIIFLLLLL